MNAEQLTSLIGGEKTALLVQVFGGRRLYFPDPRHCESIARKRLDGVIGSAAAEVLCRQFGQESHTVPVNDVALKVLRQQAVLLRDEQKLNVNEIAQLMGRSRRTIFRWLSKASPKLDSSNQQKPMDS